mmetsp:Transcript_22392/g.58356  ORF Transcript_22392/g.58356 Transcript_22392/m.58356 type:complete len:333 (-) Transcript_22392:2399-3397(-)
MARHVARTIVNELAVSGARTPGCRLAHEMFCDDKSAVASGMLFGILHGVLEGTIDRNKIANARLEQTVQLLASNITFAATRRPSAWQDAVGSLVRYKNGNSGIIDALNKMYLCSSSDRVAVSAFTAAARAQDNPYSGLVWAATTFDAIRVNALVIDNLDWVASHSRKGASGFHILTRLLVIDLGLTHTQLRAKYGKMIDDRGRVVPAPPDGGGSATRVQRDSDEVEDATVMPPKDKPRVPYADTDFEIKVDDSAGAAAKAHRRREYIIANQRSSAAERGDEDGMGHDDAMAAMLRGKCRDRTAQLVVPLPPINAPPDSDKAVSAAIQTCKFL